ncbi:MAG: DUF6901 family protein [Pseudobdellovibrionaceae bacterium]
MSEVINFEYTIKFEDGTSQFFNVPVDSESFVIKDDDEVPGPEWTLLESNKCEHCPYQAEKKKYCPVAKNLAQASEIFKNHRSFVKVIAFVKSPQRSYGKSTDLQTALFSLFGLIMASSNCPHLHLFKSMARYHLPFSSLDETSIRALGMYLLSKYIESLDDPSVKVDLTGLSEKYSAIEKVNRGIIERIRSLKGGDANKNAIVILDNFATLLPLEISSGLSEIKPIFK